MNCPNCNAPYPPETPALHVFEDDALEMAHFWHDVAQHPGNNDATRVFALAECDHWRKVADEIHAAKAKAVLA